MKHFSLILQWLNSKILFPYIHSKCVAAVMELYPTGCPWNCWFQNTTVSREHEKYCKKAEFSLGQYNLTSNIGVLLKKTCGTMKGCVFGNIFSTQNFYYKGEWWLEAAQHICLSPHMHKRVLLKVPGYSDFCLGLPDAGSKGQAGASWAGILFGPPASSRAITESV